MPETQFNRRDFGKGMLGSIVTLSFFDLLLAGCGGAGDDPVADSGAVLSPKVAPIIRHWALGVNEICRELKGELMPQKTWQERIRLLYDRIDLPELLRFIDFETLARRLDLPDLGVATRKVVFPKLEGIPAYTVFHKKIFGMKKGRAIIPHGHSNMASAHLVLKGGFHLRQYERVSAGPDSLVIRPTVDKAVGAGDHSSISDEKDNVHWFVANTDTAFTLDVIVLDLKGKKYDIHNLDIRVSQRLGDGLLRAPLIDVGTALKKYGKPRHEDSAAGV